MVDVASDASIPIYAFLDRVKSRANATARHSREGDV